MWYEAKHSVNQYIEVSLVEESSIVIMSNDHVVLFADLLTVYCHSLLRNLVVWDNLFVCTIYLHLTIVEENQVRALIFQPSRQSAHFLIMWHCPALQLRHTNGKRCLFFSLCDTGQRRGRPTSSQPGETEQEQRAYLFLVCNTSVSTLTALHANL